MDSGRICVNAAVTTESCETVLSYHKGASFGTEMAGCDVAVTREN